MQNEKLKEIETLKRLRKNNLLTDDEYLMQMSEIMQQNPEQLKKNQTEKLPMSPEEKKKYIIFSIIMLGLFSILAGLGLIVAANWAVIPSTIKVLGGLAGLGASLGAVSYFLAHNKREWAEAFLFVSFFLLGGNIALIQQSFNLAISWQNGSLLWFVLSVPLLLMTKKKFLPVCSALLFIFGVWKYLYDFFTSYDYMVVAGLLFLIMLWGLLLKGTLGKLVRRISLGLLFFVLYVGDAHASSGFGVAGIISTTIFLIILANISASKKPDSMIRFYNCLFIFAAWRIILLFWTAYYNLTSIGILLICFGTVILLGVGLYYYFYNSIQNFIKRMIQHEQ